MEWKLPVAAILLLFLLGNAGAQPNNCFVDRTDCQVVDPDTETVLMAAGPIVCCDTQSGMSFLQDSNCITCDSTIISVIGTGIPSVADEGDMLTLTIQFVPITGASAVPDNIIIVTNMDDMDTATEGAGLDYREPTGIESVAADQVEIEFDILMDALLEGEEFFTFVVQTAPGDSSGAIFADATFTVNIGDESASLLTPSFSLMNGSEVPLAGSLLPEDSAENVMFCAEVTSTTAFQVLVDFVVSIDIARSDELLADELILLRDNITLLCNSGDVMMCEACEPLITIIDDPNFELFEGFNLTAAETNFEGFEFDIELEFGVVDPEDLTIELDREMYVVDEDSCFRPQIRLMTPVSGDGFGNLEDCFAVSANVLPGDGKSGAVSSDFSVTMVSFDIPMGSTNDELIQSAEEICLLDNMDLHGNITFTIEIEDLPLSFTTGTQDTSTVVIRDDDDGSILVLLTISQAEVEEGGTFNITAKVECAGSIRNLSVAFPIVPVFLEQEGLFTAEASDIITIDDLELSFECFTEGAMASVTIFPNGNDNCLEGPEIIGFTLGEASNIPGAIPFGNTVECVITDLDLVTATVTVETTSVVVGEGDGNFAEICVSVSTPKIGNPFTVELMVGGDGSANLGDDFLLGIVPPQGCPLSPFNSGPVPPNPPAGPMSDATSLLIDFSAGQNLTACGYVTILNDNVYEDVEEIVLTIESTSPYIIASGTDDDASISISRDVKDAVLSLTSSVIETVAEGEMVDRCCFTLLTEADTQAEIQATLVSNGPDVMTPMSTIMFAAGSTPGVMQCFGIEISSDMLLEGQEVFVLEASSEDAIISGVFNALGDADGDIGDEILECAQLAGSGPFIDCIDEIGDRYPTADDCRNTTSIPLIITDGDTASVTVSFDESEDMGMEPDLDRSIQVSLDLGGIGVENPVSICINCSEAKSGTSSKKVVEIMSQATSGNLTIPIVNDQTFGPTQVFTCVIDSTDPSLGIGTIGAIIVTVTDDDDVTISLSSNEVTVTEGDPPGTADGRVCVDLVLPVGGIACDITITLNFMDATAISPQDYDNSTIDLTVEAGSAPGSPVCFDARMIIVDDDIVEETEEFMVEIMSVDPPEVIITPGTTSVLIENDDVTKLGFEEFTYNVMEAQNMNVCVIFDKELEKPISVNYTLTGFSSSGLDNIIESGVLMIGENATPQDPFLSRESCFEIGVSEDMIKEGREVLALGLDNEDPCICLGRDGAIVIVPPNGNVLISVKSVSHIQVAESEEFVKVCLEADHPSQVPFEVALLSDDITAIAGEDYVALNKSLGFAFGFDTVQCVHIPILNDECYEDFVQSFNISLSSEQDCVDFETPEFPVYIMDDDYVYVSFEVESMDVNETDGIISIFLELSNVTGSTKDPILIDVSSQDGTTGDSDFDPVATTVEFPAGSMKGSRVSFEVNIANNMAFEKDEFFSLLLVDVSEVDNLHLHIENLTINIRDDDVVSVSFNDSQIYVQEMEPAVSVCLELQNVIEPTQAVIWARATVDTTGTAIIEQDYSFDTEVVMFPVNSISGSTRCFDVPIEDNMAFEKDENFGLIIQEAEENVLIGTGSISVTIHDDDFVYVSFRGNSISVLENQTEVNVCLELRNVSVPTLAEIWVDIVSNDLVATATAGDDYISVNTTVTFGVGSVDGSPSCFDVTIDNNMAFEKSESFSLHIEAIEDNVEAHTKYFTIEIMDDDVVSLMFTQEEYTVAEGNVLMVCLQLSGANAPTQDEIWVEFSTVGDGSATPDVDFLSVSVTLSLASDSSNGDMVCQNITILSDALEDEAETFSVQATLEEGVVPNMVSATVLIGVCVPMFIDDTPRVDGVFVSVSLPACVQSAECFLNSAQNTVVDCSQGTSVVIRRNTLQTLNVRIPSLGVTLQRQLRRDNGQQCYAHATNNGLVRNGDGTATLTFETTGPSAAAQANMETSAVCIIQNIVVGGPGSSDAVGPQTCTSPFTFMIPAEVTGELAVIVRADNPSCGRTPGNSIRVV